MIFDTLGPKWSDIVDSKRLRWLYQILHNMSEILERAFIDELQTFVGSKTQIRVVDNCQPFSASHLSLGSGRSLTRLARKL